MSRILKILSVLLILAGATGCKKDQRPLVVSKVKAASKLATTEVSIDKFLFATKEKKFLLLIKLNEATFGAKTQATVKLGINLDKLKKDNVDVGDNYVNIKLPPIEVLSFDYPFDKFEIDPTLYDNAFMNKMTIVDIEDIYRQGEADIRANLKYMGVLERAQTNTRKLMTNLIAGLGYEEIYIDFEEQDEIIPQVIDPSVQ